MHFLVPLHVTSNISTLIPILVHNLKSISTPVVNYLINTAEHLLTVDKGVNGIHGFNQRDKYVYLSSSGLLHKPTFPIGGSKVTDEEFCQELSIWSGETLQGDITKLHSALECT